MMIRILISYRRQDTPYETTSIHAQLAEKFGRENVFIDVDTIPAGVDFRRYLHDAVKACDVVLAVIGQEWLGAKDDLGNRRLDEPRDFVRIEVEAALERDIRVIPVLVRDAAMPRPADLPESIRDLAFRNAVQVRPGRDFHTDMHRLIRELEALARELESPSLAQERAAQGRTGSDMGGPPATSRSVPAPGKASGRSAAGPKALGEHGPIPPTGELVRPETPLTAGMAVQVEWHGRWWAGHVLDVLPDGRVKIHYLGWDSSWDEIVPRSRLRLDFTR